MTTPRKQPTRTGNPPGLETRFGPGNPGRPKGSKNKFTGLKEAFLEVFEMMGGSQGLYDWAMESRRNKSEFYSMVTRLFPHEVNLGGSTEASSIRIEVVHTKDGNGNGNGNGHDKEAKK